MPGFGPVADSPVGALAGSSGSFAAGHGTATATLAVAGSVNCNGQLMVSDLSFSVVTVTTPGLFVTDHSFSVVTLPAPVYHSGAGTAVATLTPAVVGQIKGNSGAGSAHGHATAAAVGQVLGYVGAGRAIAGATAHATGRGVSSTAAGRSTSEAVAHGVGHLIAYHAPGTAGATVAAAGAGRALHPMHGTATATATAASGVQIPASASDTAVLRGTPTYTGGYAVTVASSAITSSTEIAALGVVITERIKAVLNQSVFWHAQITVSSEISIRDSIHRLINETLSDHAVMSTSWTLRVILQIIDQVIASAGYAAQAKYKPTMSETVSLSDALVAGFGAHLSDSIHVALTQTPLYMAIINAVETIAAAGTGEPKWLLSGVVLDDIEITDVTSPQMIFNSMILDLVRVGGSDVEPSGSLSVWQMNTRTAAVTEYDNYPFNSFARLGPQLYVGASEGGLFELDGDQDAGDPIIAAIRGGYLQFGGTHLSRIKAAYIAVRGAGEFILKIVTGADQEYIYSACAESMVSTKFAMGKGQRARYFAWELISTGQDFDLDTVEFVPIEMQRRV